MKLSITKLIIATVGLLIMAYGAWMAYPPAGPMVFGLGLILSTVGGES